MVLMSSAASICRMGVIFRKTLKQPEEMALSLRNPLGGLFSANAGDDLSSGFGYRMNGNGGLQFVEEGAAAVAKLWRIRAVDPVTDFRDADRAQDDRNLSNRLLHVLDGLGRREIPPFGSDQHAGIEN